MTAPRATPWRQWMAFGLGFIKLSPPVFWRLSLAEWRALWGGLETMSVDTLNHNDLVSMMAQYPDKE